MAALETRPEPGAAVALATALRKIRNRRRMTWVLVGLLVAYLGLCLSQFPFAYDEGYSVLETAKTVAFYEKAYSSPAAGVLAGENDIYVKTATEAARAAQIPRRVGEFVARYHLEGKKALEVGAGRGYLQDQVTDYTGLDISPTAGRYFHKPFVMGSATAMPFAENTFDAGWSIWVLEHVPNPEQALREIRRVSKDGAVLFLLPSWDAPPWAAQGYDVRPYSDFGPGGKIYKALLPLRWSNLFWLLTRPPIRALREGSTAATGQISWLRYTRLVPNYKHYWEADSDAVNLLDRGEMALWFSSRGDECLNCRGGPLSPLPDNGLELVIRIHKR
ncbi:class I SAM-dependent methyltransferase [Paludibaculum fermentans]|uniref:Class I SAM-dependent methyltransferase n=1 Tax=Paludibaculum fermentans TaxID=1473598 RepID=A0A7S7NQ89_PALFE|nr:class I SAM-dependent methyltransferase [Paludibaculum fermentans]QOY87792.1 class I SAM-dependent methyltransferase [Paludibaculum fermentans]